MKTTELELSPQHEPYSAPESECIELTLQRVILDGSITDIVEEDTLGWD